MEKRTFPLFSQLPLKLREHIWKMAIRPDKPGVDDTSDHNISTYLLDGSLLTACQESRSMMKRFERNKTSRKCYDESRAAYYLSGGAPLYITIYPKTDLIILQSDDIFEFEWDYLEDLLRQKGDCHPDIRHIGIEYDKRWGIELFEEDRNTTPWIEPVDFTFSKLFELAEEMMYLSIWLIDHNLKRRKDAPSFKASNEHEFCNPYLDTPFHANDRKFLKVNLEQGEDCLDQWQYIKPMPDGDYRKSSLHFADRLRKQACDYACREDCIVSHCSCYLGLLGWDDI